VSGRIFALAVVIAVLTLPVRASAASAPAQAPQLMSAAWASPVMIHWTPAPERDDAEEPGHGHGHGHDDDSDDEDGTLQLVLRAHGPCGSAGEVRAVASFTDPAITDFTDPVPDGTYCYSIALGDDSAMAVSPGLTVVVSTPPPPRRHPEYLRKGTPPLAIPRLLLRPGSSASVSREPEPQLARA